MDIGLSMSLGGSFYRATRNADKVNGAVNSMLNRLETGEKYQYVHENVAAIVEGSTIKGKVNANDIAVDRNDKNRTELETYMTGQKKLLESLSSLKEVATKIGNTTDDTAKAALLAQGTELVKSIDSLSKSVSFGGKNLVEANTDSININANTVGNTFALDFATVGADQTNLTTAFNNATGGTMTNLDAAITALSQNSARAGVYYSNVLGAQNDVMTGIVNANSQRYSKLISADDNETSALLNVLSSRMDAISASKQYGARYAGNSIQLANLLA